MSAPSPLPSYVYKILPNTSVYQGAPVPIPASYEFPKPQADLDDGFVHLSTLAQLPSTLQRFFGDEKTVQLLKVDYARMATWKTVKWEKASNGDSYAHLYAVLTGEFVREVKIAGKGDGEKGWEATVKKLEVEGWLEN